MAHRYLIYLIEQALLGVQIKESPLIKCVQTGFMLRHIYLWLITQDKSLLKFVGVHLLKGDNK